MGFSPRGSINRERSPEQQRCHTLRTSGERTQVTIDPTNPGQAFPVIAPTETISSVAVVFDEQGQTVLDDIVVNGNPLDREARQQRVSSGRSLDLPNGVCQPRGGPTAAQADRYDTIRLGICRALDVAAIAGSAMSPRRSPNSMAAR
jgi:hypothetical protein